MTAASRPATILEVARLAGVSKTSVSRYYSGERERLSATMQERISAAAEQVGYHPNPLARSLKGGPSGLVGMLVADIRNPFSVAIMHGVEQACRQAGLSLMVCNSDNDPDQERQQLAMMSSWRIEGLVVNAAGCHSDALRQFVTSGTPVVLLDRRLAGLQVDEVGLDNGAAIDMAIGHLLDQGYSRLLYVTEPPAQASSRKARLERFEARCRDQRLSNDVLSTELDDQRRLDAALTRLISAETPLRPAILCANGQVTLAVFRRMRALGLHAGSIGLIGIDELDWCGLTEPGITTLAQPTDAIGKAAIDCLRTRQAERNTEPRYQSFTPHLIARGSTQPADIHEHHHHETLP